MNELNKDVQLRRANQKDLKALKVLFEQSIRHSCKQDYSPAEIEVWCETVKHEQRWLDLIEEQYVIIAESKAVGEILGFASLREDYYVDFLYVAYQHQGRGIARFLLEHLEDKARKAGVKTLVSDFSLGAKTIMQRRQWRIIRKNFNKRQGEVLINFRMEKEL